MSANFKVVTHLPNPMPPADAASISPGPKSPLLTSSAYIVFCSEAGAGADEVVVADGTGVLFSGVVLQPLNTMPNDNAIIDALFAGKIPLILITWDKIYRQKPSSNFLCRRVQF
ncbi:hypothetical protein [Brevibacillus sp. DP1.3A]|uniref:hypothetical protein n=1 Tax=Brevibacillus sp. DP1.3A TaxID=2738867 RepID=UPI00156B5AEC|nr:hypothetical protein [Brevibacillus sp. DP1.3A]UED77443.1 hypothetical protein HP399_013565 [Brevibacillus sp. DP1.3A]